MYKMQVITVNEIPAIHNWTNCHLIDVDFLKYPHRHIFFIRMGFNVIDKDRQIEIFIQQQEIENYLYSTYKKIGKMNILDFTGKSCEMIASDLLDHFEIASWCEVKEDDKGGALLWR